MRIVRIPLVVKPEHCDIYGHLNNCHYDNYFEQGRIALQELYGISDEELIQRNLGLWMVSNEIRFLRQVLPNDEIVVYSNFVPYESGIRVYMHHSMKRDGHEVAISDTANVFIDLKRNLPRKPLEELIQQLNI